MKGQGEQVKKGKAALMRSVVRAAGTWSYLEHSD